MEWLWVIALLAILVGPVLIGIVRGLRNRSARVPKHEGDSEALGMIQTMKDQGNLRTGGRGW